MLTLASLPYTDKALADRCCELTGKAGTGMRREESYSITKCKAGKETGEDPPGKAQGCAEGSPCCVILYRVGGTGQNAWKGHECP